MLEQLEQANLFIIPLDDKWRWYRYHRLFAGSLRGYLQRQVGAQGLACLHRRAAEWFEQNGLAAEAMSHALATADVGRAARLVEQSSLRYPWLGGGVGVALFDFGCVQFQLL